MNATASTVATPFQIGVRVEVTDNTGRGPESFRGVIEMVQEAGFVVREATFQVRRDQPAIVNGFVRKTYWALPEQLRALTARELEYEQFEARR